MNGYCGKILRANLTEKTTRVVPVAREMALGYIGGRGFASRMMYDELKPGVDPLGPDNNIYVLTGPINGTAVPYSSRYVVATKSPLTGTYTRSLSGGEFSAQMKYAGFDGIVIEGQSDKPVYLCLENGSAEIRDAGNLWGTTTRDTEENLRKNLKGSKSLAIGPAGEQQVLFASVFNDWGRSAGGGGTGAVFGAKRLKAIVVRGQQGVRVPNKETFLELLRESYAAVKSHPGVPERIWKGTTMTVETTSKLGIIPVRNFSGGKLEGAENLYSEIFREKLVLHDESCFSCPLPCGKLSLVKTGPYKGTVLQGPQFETIGLLGTNCGIINIETVAKANSLCNLYGMDTIETGNVIGFAMECFERGILTKADTGGIDLRFGNDDALIETIEAIGQNKGIGALLSGGAGRAAHVIGQDTIKFAMSSKGKGFAAYDPRALVGMGLIYATAPTGANHSTGPTLGGEKSLGLTTNKEKPELVYKNQNSYCLMDSLVICSFSRYGLNDSSRLKILEAVTGERYEADLISKRIFSLERLFNVREGFGRSDDSLPWRSLHEPMPEGPSKGNTVSLEELLNRYYPLRKWDPQGIPTIACLKKLGLEGEIENLAQMGIKLNP